MKSYFDEFQDRKDFFDQQKKAKGIAKQKINFSAHEHDIRIDIAQRIYEIRNRVVHSKDFESSELLLPFSNEISLMGPDIDLIKFLAQKAIIAGSRPLSIR